MVSKQISGEEYAMEQTNHTSSFLKGIEVPANLDFTVLSIAPRELTIVFNNARVELGPTGSLVNRTAIQTKVITLNIPYSSDQPSLHMGLRIKGYAELIEAEAGVHVRLVVCVGSMTKVVYPTPDFSERFEFKVYPRAVKPVCQVTLFLLVEHDIDTPGAGGAVLNVDQLDMEILTPDTGTFMQ
jgi:hypothetical protein